MRFTEDSIPALDNKKAIVTGANAGIGFETARALAQKGAHVTLACRSEERGAEAVQRILDGSPSGSAELALLDLSSLDNVRAFAGHWLRERGELHLLVNNAGVMVPPFAQTADGFELQFGVNFLAHFALTGLLWPAIASTRLARVVTLSSLTHRMGAIDSESFRGENGYKPWGAYAQSKLACLIFALELSRRLEGAESDVLSLAAHPGWTHTNLQRHHGPARIFSPMMAMSAAQGALPTLYAATAPEAGTGQYIGPSGLGEMRGYPKGAKCSKAARDPQVATELWQAAEKLTGVTGWP